MAGDIEDFLRKVAQQRSQKGGRALEPIYDAEAAEEVEDAEILEDDEVSGDDVGDYVDQHLDTSRFGNRASILGSQVASSDDRIDARLHDVFEHELGALGAETDLAQDFIHDQPKKAAVASQIRQMLSSPQRLRDAIVLSEILKPPVDRW